MSAILRRDIAEAFGLIAKMAPYLESASRIPVEPLLKRMRKVRPKPREGQVSRRDPPRRCTLSRKRFPYRPIETRVHARVFTMAARHIYRTSCRISNSPRSKAKASNFRELYSIPIESPHFAPIGILYTPNNLSRGKRVG